MRRRRRRVTGQGLFVSMDSFLDIVTNTLGLLILIAALTIISGRDIRISLGSPVIAEVSESLSRVCYECRGNRLVPIDDEYAEEFQEEIVSSEAPIRDRVQRLREFNKTVHSDGYNRYEFKPEIGRFLGRQIIIPALVVLPLEEPVGDGIGDLRDTGGQFARRLDEIDPGEEWIYFIVRPDSFEVLREARALAKQRGFKIGWEPKDAGDRIVFSAFGSLGSTIDD